MAIYMWREYVAPFTPWANTLVYFPFISDANDYSWNWYALDVSGTQETIGRRFNTQVEFNKLQTPKWYFVSFWIKNYNMGTWWNNIENQMGFEIYWGMNYQAYSRYGTATDWNMIQIFTSSSWANQKKAANLSLNTWYHLAYWYGNGAAVCWINWVKYTITTGNVYDPPEWTETTFIINRSTTKWDVALSDVIVEKVLWTDQQVTDYFNATKSTYWVS